MQIQKKVLFYILKNKDSDFLLSLDTKYFSGLYSIIFTNMQEYYYKYNSIPNGGELITKIKTTVSKEIADTIIAILHSLKKITTLEDKVALKDLLQESYVIREVDNLLPDLIDSAEHRDFNKVESYANKILELKAMTSKILPQSLDKVEYQNEGMLTLPFYLKTLNDIGLNLSGLTIIGSGSGQGKSVLALNQLLFLAKQGIKVGMLSLELPESQVILRLYANDKNIEYGELLKKAVTNAKGLKEDINKWKEKYKDQIFLNSHRYSLDEIKQAVMYLIQKGVKFIVIDYLNLVELENTEEWKALAKLVKDLHDLTLKYNVVILSPTQLNLSEDKNKNISVSTRGTKELEFSASVFLLIYQNSEEFKENVARIIIQKSRVSKKVTALAKTDFKFMRFEDTGVILDE